MAIASGPADIESSEGVKSALLVPLGDSALLVRFGDKLSAKANARAIAAARLLEEANLEGVVEIAPNLVSVLLRYNPGLTGFHALSGVVGLVLSAQTPRHSQERRKTTIPVEYGGSDGPDLEDAATACGLSPKEFIEAHTASRLRVLATGFAPGFVYCGMHEKKLSVPRRKKIHAMVAPGSIIFAAGQTAIVATQVPTGWHVIGRTDFMNFDPTRFPPTRLVAGEEIRFVSNAPDDRRSE
jgi:KipI family sensor histidine kinase inhibitor